MSALLPLGASTVGPSIDWYLTRSTGAVAMLLLTLTVALGVIDVQRLSTPRWPRFFVDSMHRSVSLLALVFLVLHILTSSWTAWPISLLAAFVPFTSPYRPFWLGLGAISFDLVLAVTITSLLRRRLGFRAWRATHWLAYASWPLALLHGLGTGSDVESDWLLALSIGCVVVVIVALLSRILVGWPSQLRRRSAALGGVAAFALFLALWLPSGPLGHEWARRSGTPASLLAGTSRSASVK